MVFSVHPLTFFTRLVHVIAMAFLLGGSLLLWGFSIHPEDRGSDDYRFLPGLLILSRRYERLFWLAAGLILLTGVGNLGAFGAGLPGAASPWGMKLLLKLSTVLLFLPLSLLRTMLVAGLRPNAQGGLSLSRSLQILYLSTALYLVWILFLAISLAHG